MTQPRAPADNGPPDECAAGGAPVGAAAAGAGGLDGADARPHPHTCSALTIH